MTRCDGYGTDPHPTGHATVEVRAPIPARYCGECWRRWLMARPRPHWTATEKGDR